MKTIDKRMTAGNDDDVVVFLIGMRINRWWKVHQWARVGASMPRMLKELYANPDLGWVYVFFAWIVVVGTSNAAAPLGPVKRSADQPDAAEACTRAPASGTKRVRYDASARAPDQSVPIPPQLFMTAFLQDGSEELHAQVEHHLLTDELSAVFLRHLQ